MHVLSLVCIYSFCCVFLLIDLTKSTYILGQKIKTPLLILPTTHARDEIAFILLPESGVRCEAYIPLVNALKTATHLQLWVAVLNTTSADRAIDRLPYVIADSLERLNQRGMRGTKVFLAAHGDSGPHIQLYARLVPDIIQGVILYSSHSDHHTQSAQFPVPLLVISGDVDGITRLSGHVSWYNKLRQSSHAAPNGIDTNPLIIVKDVNHGSMYSNGEHSPRLDKDFRQVTLTDMAVEQFVKYTSAFMVNVLKSPASQLQKSRQILQRAIKQTQIMFQPFLDIADLSIRADMTSPWSRYSQVWLSGLLGPLSRRLRVQNHVIDAHNSSHPTVSLQRALVTVTTLTHFLFNSTATGTDKSPSEIQLRMVAPEVIQSLVRDFNNSRSWTTKMSNHGFSCKDLNYAAYVTACQTASRDARQRFYAMHRGVLFNDDVIATNTREWLEQHVTIEHKGREVIITGIRWRRGINHALRSETGLYYCKVLAPSRFLDWIYGDSLVDGGTL